MYSTDTVSTFANRVELAASRAKTHIENDDTLDNNEVDTLKSLIDTTTLQHFLDFLRPEIEIRTKILTPNSLSAAITAAIEVENTLVQNQQRQTQNIFPNSRRRKVCMIHGNGGHSTENCRQVTAALAQTNARQNTTNRIPNLNQHPINNYQRYNTYNNTGNTYRPNSYNNTRDNRAPFQNSYRQTNQNQTPFNSQPRQNIRQNFQNDYQRNTQTYRTNNPTYRPNNPNQYQNNYRQNTQPNANYQPNNRYQNNYARNNFEQNRNNNYSNSNPNSNPNPNSPRQHSMLNPPYMQEGQNQRNTISKNEVGARNSAGPSTQPLNEI